MTEDKLIAALDPNGFRPLSIGQMANGAWVVSSETCAFEVVGAKWVRDVKPGELVIIDDNGIQYDTYTNDTQLAICSMEYIYFARPDSDIYGVNVHTARKNMGKRLAQEFQHEADIVVGVPNSSLSAAMGVAEESGLPNEMGLVKNQYTQRTFIQPTQELREQGVRMKLSAVSGVVKGKRVVMVDDSIVRGTQLRDNVKILYDYGAKEVHMRIACPPLIYSCPFIGFTSSKSPLELITRQIIKELEGDENKNLDKYATTDSPEYKKMVGIIAERFGLSSLKFNTLETLVEAIGLPKCKVCTHCFDGSSCF